MVAGLSSNVRFEVHSKAILHAETSPEDSKIDALNYAKNVRNKDQTCHYGNGYTSFSVDFSKYGCHLCLS